MTLERLQKYLSRMGLCSRRQAEEWMKAGRVRVNEQVVTELGTKIDAELDAVWVNGRLVQLAPPPITVILHKPYGYVSSTADPQGRRVVTELLAEDQSRLYLVGRLDYDATGLMVLTNDGEMAFRLMHPSYQVPRIYRVTVAGEVAPETIKLLAAGIKVHGRLVPAEVAVVKQEAERTVLELTVREGRYHLVKRLMERVGHPVLKLKRVGFGPLKLGKLARGAYRELSPEELEAVKTEVGLK